VNSDRVGIIGIGQSNFRSRRDDASYPDLVREAVVPAMLDAKLDFDAIDAVVY
jgi:acetyl-CoA C-acetyltransferase